MPVYSMTGYASAQHTPGSQPASNESGKPATPAGRLGLEIRSVNSRFLDLWPFRPGGEELRSHEPGPARVDHRARSSEARSKCGPASKARPCRHRCANPSVRTLQRVSRGAGQRPQAWMPEAGAAVRGRTAPCLAPNRPAATPTGPSRWLELAKEGAGRPAVGARERECARPGDHAARAHLKQLRPRWSRLPPVPQLVEQLAHPLPGTLERGHGPGRRHGPRRRRRRTGP